METPVPGQGRQMKLCTELPAIISVLSVSGVTGPDESLASLKKGQAAPLLPMPQARS